MVHFNLIIEMYAQTLSEEALAKSLCISKDVIHQKIYGEVEFELGEIEKIMTLFPYCTVDYLFNRYEQNKKAE